MIDNFTIWQSYSKVHIYSRLGLAVPQIKDVRKALAKLGDDPAKKYAESLK